MEKSILKNYLVEHQAEVVSDLKEAVAAYGQAVNLDDNEVIDTEDISHQGEADDLLLAMTQQLKRAEAELKRAETLSLEACEKVALGALVETERSYFYVSISMQPFEWEGKSISPLSTHSPLYSSMMGKKAGETFKHGKYSYTILSVS